MLIDVSSVLFGQSTILSWGALNRARQEQLETSSEIPGKGQRMVSPSLGPYCYQVREDVVAAFHEAYSDRADACFVQQSDGSIHLDMWTALTCQLRSSGNQEEHFELASICTACHTEVFYSNRAEGGKTGRFTGMITLLL